MKPLQLRIDTLLKEQAHVNDADLQTAFDQAIQALRDTEATYRLLDRSKDQLAKVLLELYTVTQDLLTVATKVAKKTAASVSEFPDPMLAVLSSKTVLIMARTSLDVVKTYGDISEGLHEILSQTLTEGLLSEEESYQAMEAAKRAFAALWEVVAIFVPALGALGAVKNITEAVISNPDHDAWKKVSERLAFLRMLPFLAHAWIGATAAVVTSFTGIHPVLVERISLTRKILNDLQANTQPNIA